MLTGIVKGRTATEVAQLPKEELLEEIGIPLTPIRLKCAILGLGVLKVALHERGARHCPTSGRASTLTELEIAPIDELPPGEMKLVEAGAFGVGVYNCGGELYAIEDRCSHDDGPVCLGDWDEEACTVDLPAARRAVRPEDGQGAQPARVPTGPHLPRPSRSRHGQGRPRLTVSPRSMPS